MIQIKVIDTYLLHMDDEYNKDEYCDFMAWKTAFDGEEKW